MAIKNKYYPFQDGEELKNSGLSDIDISFELENMDTGLRMAVVKLKEVIGKNVFVAILNHYNSDDFQKDEPSEAEALQDSLVENMQRALAPFAFLETFVWRRLRVSNNSITVAKADGEDRPYKYDLDEAKNNLFRLGWTFTTELIELLNENVPEDANDPKNVFDFWKASEQYTTMKELIIKDYKDFNKHYYIDQNAAFFIRTLNIQQKLIADDITPRINIVWETVPAEGETAEIPKTSDKIIKLAKDYLAYMTVSKACFEMEPYYLPDSIRHTIENEQYKKKGNNHEFIKEKLSNSIAFEAQKILDSLDMEIASQETPEEGDTYMSDLEDIGDEDDKFYFPGV